MNTDLYTSTYNPDVLSCLANLSNDEVFTPPEIANQMLDLLPQELFSDPNTTFLDPACKSGVFLREIAKRLLKGLEKEIPDLHERVDHIFQKQVYGIAITEMTSLLSRRSVYCSKYPNSVYSVSAFKEASGNIHFTKIPHRWVGDKCTFCGTSQTQFGDEVREGLETHAYEFIHTTRPEEIFDMKFDVIIGNPPYQLDTGGAGRQAKPIYQLFIEQAKKLNPRYLSMIIPSRWFAGGMGLDDFRDSMLKDNHIKDFVDYSNAKECFPQNSISGGVCYFLKAREYSGPCTFTNIREGKTNTLLRNLDEFPVLIRYNEAVQIIRKILPSKEDQLTSIVSSLTPFGLPTNYRGSSVLSEKKFIKLFTSEGMFYISDDEITKGQNLVNKYKVLVSKTGSEHAGEPSKDGKYRVFSSSMKVLGKGDVCTHSYFVIGGYDQKDFAENLFSYLQTKFVRFLILQSMTSINLSKSVFQFVPKQDFSKPWTDEELYEKYGVTDEEIAFIDSMIRPMDLSTSGTDHD